jgi:hypothetical protein
MLDHKECVIVVDTDTDDELNIFVCLDGVKIAKRGHPGTRQAKTWVSLEPGFEVYDGKRRKGGGGTLVILHNGVPIH